MLKRRISVGKNMRKLTFLFVLTISLFTISTSYAGRCGGKVPCPPKACDDQICCARMGGVSYCDSSAGRLVCANGYYSSCYCTRHGVMDLQLLQGCCLWQGGISTIDIAGDVICNNGSVSEECTLQNISARTNGIW